MDGFKTVLATHEEPQELAGGPWLGDHFPGVALPDRKALGRWVIVRFGNVWTAAQVADVGPWTTDDSAYVFGIARPRAEQYKGKPCPRTLSDPSSRATLPGGRPVEFSNGAGIDIFSRVAKELGIPIGENVTLDWKLLEI